MLFFVLCVVLCCVFFFFKQKTAYEMRISDWEFRRVLFRSPLSTTDQWQGLKIHPVGYARVGLCPHLPELPTPDRRHEILATPLQLAPPSPGHRTCRSEERRVGKECVRTFSYRGSSIH